MPECVVDDGETVQVDEQHAERIITGHGETTVKFRLKLRAARQACQEIVPQLFDQVMLRGSEMLCHLSELCRSGTLRLRFTVEHLGVQLHAEHPGFAVEVLHPPRAVQGLHRPAVRVRLLPSALPGVHVAQVPEGEPLLWNPTTAAGFLEGPFEERLRFTQLAGLQQDLPLRDAEMGELLAGGVLFRHWKTLRADLRGLLSLSSCDEAGHDIYVQYHLVLVEPVRADEGQVRLGCPDDVTVPLQLMQGEDDIHARSGLQGNVFGARRELLHLPVGVQGEFMIAEFRLERADVPERPGLTDLIPVCLRRVQTGEVVFHGVPVLSVCAGHEPQAVEGPRFCDAVFSRHGGLPTLRERESGALDLPLGEEGAAE
ncbi:hypothetical protein GCM10008960_41660 [Deinococcus sedimenti]|uniref:Uncharacterized protein n=1 Tax=Deinococcus sedimenti TaxID=1867090 RepID=A0ABQ2SDK1_9DEIO|nr:hypothetical protein GCM10008960_41660 [Deinococcus sedimenti]